MCECRIIAPSSHQGDNQNVIAINVEVNDVRKPFESAGTQSICSDSELKRVFTNSPNGSEVLGEKFIAQPVTFVIVPRDSGDNIAFELWSIRQLPHQRRFSIRRMSSS